MSSPQRREPPPSAKSQQAPEEACSASAREHTRSRIWGSTVYTRAPPRSTLAGTVGWEDIMKQDQETQNRFNGILIEKVKKQTFLIQQRDEDIKTLEQEVWSLLHELDFMKSTMEGAREIMAELQQDKTSLRKKRALLKEENASLQKENASLQEENARLRIIYTC